MPTTYSFGNIAIGKAVEALNLTQANQLKAMIGAFDLSKMPTTTASSSMSLATTLDCNGLAPSHLPDVVYMKAELGQRNVTGRPK